jgi:hypothetical protein
MKLIMESWRKFLIESPLYDYEPEKFAPLSLYHEDNGDNGELVLYHMMPSIVDNGMYIVGYLSYDETQEPCIPKTYQVGGVYVEEQARGKGFSKVMYDLLFAISKDKGFGVTSDHSFGTTDVAKEKVWNSIEASGEYNKRETDKGNSKFDYNNRTPDDPKDDCEAGVYDKPAELATHHSFEKQSTGKDEQTYKNLIRNHLLNIRYLKSGKDMKWLEGQLSDRGSTGFSDAYTAQIAKEEPGKMMENK